MYRNVTNKPWEDWGQRMQEDTLKNKLGLEVYYLLERREESMDKYRELLEEYEKSSKKDGAAMITIERARQIYQKGFNKEHDREHRGGDLALAAVCYATPKRLYEIREWVDGTISFFDPWPDEWAGWWDKRKRHGGGEKIVVADPKDYSPPRIRELVIAGALIAAEIDRLLDLKKYDEPGIITDLLSLAGVEVTPTEVSNWADDMREEASNWGAAAAHLRASDNDVEVPVMPTFLEKFREMP